MANETGDVQGGHAKNEAPRAATLGASYYGLIGATSFFLFHQATWRLSR